MNRFDRLVSVILEDASDNQETDDIALLEKARPDINTAVFLLMKLAEYGKADLAGDFIEIMKRSVPESGAKLNPNLPLDGDIDTFIQLLDALNKYGWCVGFKDFKKLIHMKAILLSYKYDYVMTCEAISNSADALDKLVAAGYFDADDYDKRTKGYSAHIACKFAGLQRNVS